MSPTRDISPLSRPDPDPLVTMRIKLARSTRDRIWAEAERHGCSVSTLVWTWLEDVLDIEGVPDSSVTPEE